MADNYDDIIREVLMATAAPKPQPAPPAPAPRGYSFDSFPGRQKKLMETTDFEADPGTTGARIPPDSVRDFKYYYEVAPETGGYQTPPQLSDQEIADQANVPILRSMRDKKIAALNQDDPFKAMEEYRKLDAEYEDFARKSLKGRQDLRSYERTTNRKSDADAIQEGIDARQKTGRRAP